MIEETGDESGIEVLGAEVEDYSGLDNLSGVSSEIVEIVSGREAELIFAQSQMPPLDDAVRAINEKILSGYRSTTTDETKFRLAYFIAVGSPTTRRLGAGERAGVINSYLAAFGRWPASAEDWRDVIKIANGRWPGERNPDKEKEAQTLFKKIYLRPANMENANDNAAVTVIAYGLRPALRNLDSEKAAILIFKKIFGYQPAGAVDWDIVRAIAYSGAVR